MDNDREGPELGDGDGAQEDLALEALGLPADAPAEVRRSAFAMMRSGPLPMVSDFRGYNEVLPGAADRILSMAEKAQDSLIRLNEQDNQTTRRAYLASNFATAYFPWVALGATVVLAAVGADSFAWVAGVVTAISGGPQVVITIRDAFKRNDRQSEDDGQE